MTDKTFLLHLRKVLLSHVKTLGRLPEAVWKRTGALNTWGTNALEGNTLTAAEVEQLLLEQQSVSGRPVPDVIETLQHEQAFRSLLQRRSRPLDLAVVQELHEDVFRGIPAMRPGQWRLTNPYIGGTRYRPPRRERVVPRLDAWLQGYGRRFAKREDAFELAAWFHHEFEAIHPFENGNGRVDRLLLNLHFLRRDWPPVHLGPPDRAEYLRALESGHRPDYGPLRKLLEDAMSRSLLDLLDQIGGLRDELRPLASFGGASWNPYGAHYLSLRARQGALAAIHATQGSAPAASKRLAGRPRYLTSERALRFYIKTRARRDALDRQKGRSRSG